MTDTYAGRAIAALDVEMTEPIPGELLQLYALLALTKGTATTLKDVHDAWSLWRMATRPDHPSLIPFDDLTEDVQDLDWPYLDAIHRAARKWKP